MNVFKLPDLGEGLPDAEIVQWHVKEGDTVEIDQPLVSMETAKAVVEVPSPLSGTIATLHGKEGDTIDTGAPLVSFEGEVESTKQDTGTVVGKVEVGDTVVQERTTSTAKGHKVLPAVRAIAKKLGVDLSTITPTGKDGTITKQDVENAHADLTNAGPMEPLKGVRKAMAQTMASAHEQVVQVTISDDADISAWTEKDYTSRILKALGVACQKEPSLNAWFDGKAMGRRLIDQVDVGLAMDTEDGLFVPVIQDINSKDAKALRDEVETLKSEVLNRTIAQDKLKGATISISNFGNFVGRYASPIVVPPMVAILGVGKVRDELVPVNGDPKVCTILPLSLSIDHRAVTGGEAARFLKVVIEELAKP